MNDGVSLMYLQSTDADGNVSWLPFAGSAVIPDPFTPVGPFITTAAILLGWDGAAFERIRVSKVFTTAQFSEANTFDFWTPAAGKKFRLMGFTVSVAGTLAAPGIVEIDFLDGGAGAPIWSGLATVQDTLTGDTQLGADLGQGFLSSTADNALTVTLDQTFVTGEVTVTAWGTEE